jgi:tetratricopeptide (TPR) repeat protein
LTDADLFDEAQQWSVLAIALNPNAAETWIARGNIHQRLRQWEQAKEAYERALSFNPLALVALNNLANTYDELEQDADAEQAYRIIMQRYPEAAETYYNYGVFHDKRGDSLADWAFIKRPFRNAPGTVRP